MNFTFLGEGVCRNKDDFWTCKHINKYVEKMKDAEFVQGEGPRACDDPSCPVSTLVLYEKNGPHGFQFQMAKSLGYEEK